MSSDYIRPAESPTGDYAPPPEALMEEVLALLQPGLDTRPLYTRPEFNPRAVRYVMSVAVPELEVNARWTGTNGRLGRYRLIPLKSYYLEESNDTAEGILDREKGKRQVEWTTWENVICLIDQTAQYGAVYLTPLTGIEDEMRVARIIVAVLGGLRTLDHKLVDVRAFLENRETEHTKGWGTSSAFIRRVLGAPERDEHGMAQNDAARAEDCRMLLTQAHAAGEKHLADTWNDSKSKVAQKRKSKLDKFDYYCAAQIRETPPEQEHAVASMQAAGQLSREQSAANADLVERVLDKFVERMPGAGGTGVQTEELDAKLAELREIEARLDRKYGAMLAGADAPPPAVPPEEPKGDGAKGGSGSGRGR